jgi:hypothetical protein
MTLNTHNFNTAEQPITLTLLNNGFATFSLLQKNRQQNASNFLFIIKRIQRNHNLHKSNKSHSPMKTNGILIDKGSK